MLLQTFTFSNMAAEPLQTAHKQVLTLQNALAAGGMGILKINSNDSLECDDIASRLLGCEPPTAPQDIADFLMLIEESQHEDFLDALGSIRSEKHNFERILRLEKPGDTNASGFKFSAQSTRLPGDAEICVCGLLQPLPESSLEVKKRSESALAEVRSANAELANFASIASHDMREPLRMITSYLRLLQERSPKALDARARRYIDYACEGADRMRRLIEDLLSYARLDQSDKNFEPLALEDIMAHAIDNLRTSIVDTQAEVTVAIDHAPIVMGDGLRLTRLFQNLIANGIKFNRPGEIPRVHICFEDGSHVQSPEKWIVRIVDQGIGIDPDHHEMLFNLFQRLNTRDEFEGSGIGLAVCKKISEQHGGRIWFDSAPNKGSTFHVALAKADAKSLG